MITLLINEPIRGIMFFNGEIKLCGVVLLDNYYYSMRWISLQSFKFIVFADYNQAMKYQQRNQLIEHLLKNIDSDNTDIQLEQSKKQSQQNRIVLSRNSKRSFKNPYSVPNKDLLFTFKTPFHHVYELFNTFGINQTALITPDFEESFMRTYFYHKIVTKVEKYKHAVLINVVPISELQQPSLPYIIQRFKSQGNAQLHALASKIEQIFTSLVELKNMKLNTIIQEDKESITKYLNQLSDQMYISISNSLLQYLGYDIDQFCVETIKYRTVLFDFLSSNIYPTIKSHALNTLKHLMDVDLNRITAEDYVKLSKLQFVDYIYTKNYTKSYCDMEFIIPVRGVLCIKVKKVHYQSNQLAWRPYGTSETAYNEQKQRIKEKQFQLLNKLEAVPSNWLIDCKTKVAGYKIVKDEKEVDQRQV